MSPTPIMEIWIFSYNRGPFLQNCIASIERCIPTAQVSVFDDNSDDGETRAVLDKIAQKYRVVQPQTTALQSKHGGLYSNMQALIDNNDIVPAADLICCIQDDTQWVRALEPREVAAIDSLFDERPNLGFIHPAFMRGCNEATDGHRTRFDERVHGYYVDRLNNAAGAFYSDIFISRVTRLQSRHWTFLPREAGNEAAARACFEQMVYWRNPFVAWLPNVPAFRGKRQTIAMQLAQKQQASDLYPIDIMTAADTQSFCTRPSAALPFAEHYLHTGTAEVTKPWRYYPLQGKRWLKRLNQLELSLHKIKAKFIR